MLYRDAEIRKYQYFAYSGWPGGLFGSPTMAGTRPGMYIVLIYHIYSCISRPLTSGPQNKAQIFT